MTMTVPERIDDREASFRSMLEGWQSGIQTGMPGIIVSRDGDRVSVQPSIQARLTGPTGGEEWVNLPVIPDVKIVWPGGGGMTLTFPVGPGDECWIAFSSRCLDGWFQQGGVQRQLDARMHSLSDAVAFVGLRSQPRALEGISDSAVQLRSDAGGFGISLDATTGKIRIECTDLEIVSTTLKHNDVNVGSDHLHQGVTPGAGNSGPPVP